MDKFLKWALTGGRFLVILTESIALCMFLYRFDIDRKLIDLHDAIKQKQAIVSHLTANEASFRNLQDRLKKTKTLIQESTPQIEIFGDVITLANSTISITNIAVGEKDLLLQGSTRSKDALSNFIKTLQKHKDIASVNLDTIGSNPSTATFTFSLSAALKTNAKTDEANSTKGVSP